MVSGKAIVLAAGMGKRLQSEVSNLPKVLREAEGRPLLGYVLEHINFLEPADITIVIGYRGEQVAQAAGEGYQYVWQHEQLGTGHAVSMALPSLEGYEGPVLVCYGDMPLIRRSTYMGLFEQHQASRDSATVLAYVTGQDLAYGRIIRDEAGRFQTVVEAKDCTPEQLRIRELNAGVYIFDAAALRGGLAKLDNDNVQNEYYLTDVPAHIIGDGGSIGVYQTTGEYEGIGVNTEADLALVEQILRREQDAAGYGED